MRKLVVLAALLLVSAMTGRSAASPIDLSAISAAGAVTASPEGHSYGDDGMVWTPTVASADCLAATAPGWCATIAPDGSSAPDRPFEDVVRQLVAAFGPAWQNAIGPGSGWASSTGEWYTASPGPDTVFSPLFVTAALNGALAQRSAGLVLGDLGVAQQLSMPEPMTLLLVGAGLAGLRSLRRRR